MCSRGYLNRDYILIKLRRKYNILIEISQVKTAMDAQTLTSHQNLAESEVLDQGTAEKNKISKTNHFYIKLN